MIKQKWRLVGMLAFSGAVLLNSCRSHFSSQVSENPARERNLPEFLDDPLEPLNRGISTANAGLLLGVVRPVSRVYRGIVPMPARRSIGSFAYNLNYPGRLINHSLQGNWQKAGTETTRFLSNSTVGVAGLFDPASRWNIPKADTKFADTFVKWGWKPKHYVVLPIFGPSDETHATGFMADKLTEPWNYVDEVSGLGGGITLNRLSDQVERLAQFIETEPDAYMKSKYLWTYASKTSPPPSFSDPSAPHPPTLETLDTAKFRLDDPKFLSRSDVRAVQIPATGKKIRYNYWLQKETAPLVFIAPGLGSHRISNNTLLIAEYLFQQGFSVVTTVGIFHPEFIENASSVAMPAYPATDSADMLSYFTEVNKDLENKYPERFGKRALIGFSLGGFQALYLAANEKTSKKGSMPFDRYIAINPPVDLRYGDKELDRLFFATKAWPEAERQERINGTLQKAAMLAFAPPKAEGSPNFDGIESKYLVGLTFRLILCDSIYVSQRKENQGVLKSSTNPWRRNPIYEEILSYSFHEYFENFALPYYQKQGISPKDFARETNLKTYERALKRSDKVRVIGNENDFLLQESDVAWLRRTFGTSRLSLFPRGGHIGNMSSPPVKQAMLNALNGLQ